MLPVIIGIQVITHFQPGFFRWFAAHAQLDWDTLNTLHVHRLVLSPLIQSEPGLVGTVLWLVIVLVPALEFRAGSRRTAAVFFVGDWISTIGSLLALRLAVSLGSMEATLLLARPDSGSSSGAFACASALGFSLPGKWRFLAAGILWSFVAYRIGFHHRYSDFQHGLAAFAGIVLAPKVPPKAALDAVTV